MDLVDLLISFPVVVGTVFGLMLAGIVHWFAPSPEPVTLEAGLVVLGFLGGLFWGYKVERDSE